MDCRVGVSAGDISRNNWARVKITHDYCGPGSLWIRIVAVCQRHISGQAWDNTGKASHSDGVTIGAVCAGSFTAMREYDVQWKVRVREGTKHHTEVWRSHALWRAG